MIQISNADYLSLLARRGRKTHFSLDKRSRIVFVLYSLSIRPDPDPLIQMKTAKLPRVTKGPELRIRITFNADADPTFYINADPDRIRLFT
jgi:hypothetical protein